MAGSRGRAGTQFLLPGSAYYVAPLVHAPACPPSAFPFFSSTNYSRLHSWLPRSSTYFAVETIKGVFNLLHRPSLLETFFPFLRRRCIFHTPIRPLLSHNPSDNAFSFTPHTFFNTVPLLLPTESFYPKLSSCLESSISPLTISSPPAARALATAAPSVALLVAQLLHLLVVFRRPSLAAVLPQRPPRARPLSLMVRARSLSATWYVQPMLRILRGDAANPVCSPRMSRSSRSRYVSVEANHAPRTCSNFPPLSHRLLPLPKYLDFQSQILSHLRLRPLRLALSPSQMPPDAIA